MRTYDKLFIGGEWVDPAGSDTIDVISPHTEEVVGRVPEGTEADIDRAVAAARDAFDNGDWPRMAPAERAEIVQNFGDIYAARMMDMAEVITEEMGSPITFSQLAQAPGAVDDAQHVHPGRRGVPVGGGARPACSAATSSCAARASASSAPSCRGTCRSSSRCRSSRRRCWPGCTIVIKPSPETPLDAFLMAELLEEAGIPKGVVSIVPAGREVGEHLVRHPGVDKIAFTGSTAAGRTHRQHLRRAAQAVQPRARRQVGRDHPRRRRPRHRPSRASSSRRS